MKQTETELGKLYGRLRELGAMLPGTLDRREGVCGKAGCRCKDKEHPVKHGPYHRLCVGKRGLTGTFHVREEEAEAVRRMCARFQESKEILSDIALATMRLWRDTGAAKTEVVIRGVVAAGTHPGLSAAAAWRTLETSRGKWKAKAAARRAEQEKDRITLRDLAGSREKWRAEALGLRKAAALAAKRVLQLEHELDDAKKNA